VTVTLKILTLNVSIAHQCCEIDNNYTTVCIGITALEMAEGKPPYGDIHPMRVCISLFQVCVMCVHAVR